MFDQPQEKEQQLMTTITITGATAADPRFLITSEGVAIASFRFASTDRRYNRATEKWEDGDTTWFTVSAFRGLAENVKASVKKGERLIITGRLRIRDWETDDRKGTDVEIEADAIGHDLTWGTSQFIRNPRENVDAAQETETTSPVTEPATA
jgi:single-strand DNA-binding protein